MAWGDDCFTHLLLKYLLNSGQGGFDLLLNTGLTRVRGMYTGATLAVMALD